MIMKDILDHPARGQPGRPPRMRGRSTSGEIVRVSPKVGGIEVVRLSPRMSDPVLGYVVRKFETRIEAVRFAEEAAGSGFGVIRRRIGRDAAVIVGRSAANVARSRRAYLAAKRQAQRAESAVTLSNALLRLAALPPGFTDDLLDAPPFPAGIPEILGGD